MSKVSGAVELTAKLRKGISPRGLELIADTLYQSGLKVESDARISLNEGAVSGANHVPSKPGEPPNTDTHVLEKSIRTEVVGPFHVQVSASAPYASAQEFGNSRLPPRPYMAPALQRNRKAITENLAKAVNTANRIKS